MTDVDTAGGYEAVPTLARVSRSGSDTRARSQVVMVRLTPEEKAAIDAEAAREGVSAPELLRRAFWVLTYTSSIEESING